jgi:hypothetical protein
MSEESFTVPEAVPILNLTSMVRVAMGGELGEILAVRLPGRDPLSILWRAEGLNEYCETLVLLLVVSARESEHLAVGREYRVKGIKCNRLSFVALRSTGNLVRILPV